MTALKRVLFPVVLAAGLLLGSAGCSDSGSTAKSTTTKPGGSATTVKSGPTTTLPDDGSEFCATVKRLNADGSLDPATSGQPGGPEKMQKGLTELEGVAPDSLKSSIRTVAAALEKIATTQASTQAELEELNGKISTEDVNDASLALESYVRDHCKVELGG